MAQRAILYDGQTATRHIVRVEALACSIAITRDGFARETIPVSALHRVSKDGSNVRLERKGHEGWRLIVPKPLDKALDNVLPGGGRYGGFIDRVGIAPAVVLLAAIAAGLLGALYFAPSLIVPLIPEPWEENVGDAMVGDFGERRCSDPEAEAAVDALVERLAGAGTAARIDSAILDVDFENAAALPGGHIVLFDGAIKEWDDPDALAGVIAHEIAHVEQRHVTEALVREFGLGAIIRLFADDLGAQTQALVELTYTRSNEEEADAEAIEMLSRAGIDMRPTARLFDRFADREGDASALDFLSSHPGSAARADRFRAAAEGQNTTRPAFTDAEWTAIRSACDG